MATLLESVGVFADVFDFFLPFLLVFAILYALLMKTKFLSENANVNAVISFAIAMIVALSGAGKFIMTLTPYMAGIFVIVFLIFLVFLFFGAKPEAIFSSNVIPAIIILIGIIFVFYVVSQLYGPSMSTITPSNEVAVNETGSNVTVSAAGQMPGPETCDFAHMAGNQAMACIIGHPKVLGVIVLLGLLAIATFFVVYVPKGG
jgi:hypothetical protein